MIKLCYQFALCRVALTWTSAIMNFLLRVLCYHCYKYKWQYQCALLVIIWYKDIPWKVYMFTKMIFEMCLFNLYKKTNSSNANIFTKNINKYNSNKNIYFSFLITVVYLSIYIFQKQDFNQASHNIYNETRSISCSNLPNLYIQQYLTVVFTLSQFSLSLTRCFYIRV